MGAFHMNVFRFGADDQHLFDPSRMWIPRELFRCTFSGQFCGGRRRPGTEDHRHAQGRVLWPSPHLGGQLAVEWMLRIPRTKTW